MTYYTISTKDEGVQYRRVPKGTWASLTPGRKVILSERVIKDWEFRRQNGTAILDVECGEFRGQRS